MPIKRVPVEAGDFFGVAWLANSWLVVGYDPNTTPGVAIEVWRLRPDGSSFPPVDLPQGAGCRLTRYSHPTVLADGRLGLLQACLFNDVTKDAYRLVAYSFPDRTLEPLMSDELGFRALGNFSWDPRLSRGAASITNGICATIVGLTPAGLTRLSMTVSARGATYDLAEDFFGSGPDCNDKPRAAGPVWSPDGRRIAFLFSPQSEGTAGQQRLDVPWDLYVRDTAALVARRQLSGITFPSVPSWSPDGRSLSFSGTFRGVRGTWLYTLGSRLATRISPVELEWLAWSPDGERIAGIRTLRPGEWPPRREIVILRLKR